MEINYYLNALLKYALTKNLLVEDDYYYAANALIDLFKLDEFRKEETPLLTLDEILANLIDYAINNKIIENSNENKDLFDTRIMGIFTPLPSSLNSKFYSFSSTRDATLYFYNLCKDLNYIRASRIAKDLHFDYESEYGTINISINMSKPEKDPNDIKKLLTSKPKSYPKCMLCVENLNYAGRIGFPARQTLRYIPLKLNNEQYYIQYSPYSYFNEHLICFHQDHFNMQINANTFKELLDFVTIFPFYFIGSNADLPIVGGSILNHEHYQGGKQTLPMENAKETYLFTTNGVEVNKLYWPMSVIRLKGTNKDSICELASKILNNWRSYKNEKLNLVCEDEEGLHHTITPIARFKNNKYELDLVLRNNKTSKERPLGLYHPRESYWHIKKENIGLIEVMGLAILPARLNKEMKVVKKYLLKEELTTDELASIDKHLAWIKELEKGNINANNVDAIIEKGIGNVFTNVLKDCAVFSDDNQKEFEAFISLVKD